MILEDFVMLGTTVPEPNSDGRVFVCSAGLSQELGQLIRVYPLARRDIPHRWHTYRVHLERPERNADSRVESWKVAGDRRLGYHERINHEFEQVKGRLRVELRRKLLERFVVPSIDYANSKRLSLAIVHPEREPDLDFLYNPESPDSPQQSLFDPEPRPTCGAKRFPYIPKLRFRDDDGWHHLMLRDWGCYELMRKHGYEYATREMANALHLGPESSLLIGNLNHHRTSWLVISVLNHLRSDGALPFDIQPERDRQRREARQLVDAVIARFGSDCHICHEPVTDEDQTIDHLVPLNNGGENDLENLRLAHRHCNSARGVRPGGAAA